MLLNKLDFQGLYPNVTINTVASLAFLSQIGPQTI